MPRKNYCVVQQVTAMNAVAAIADPCLAAPGDIVRVDLGLPRAKGPFRK
jgi:hypothetical protein